MLRKIALLTTLIGVPTFTLATVPAVAQDNPQCQIGRLPPHPGNFKLQGNVLMRRMATRPLRQELSPEEKSSYNQAISCFESALRDRRANSDPEIWNGYGVALARLGRYEDALKAYDRGLRIRPGGRFVDRVQPTVQSRDFFILWFNRATALGDLERYPQALENLDRSLRLNGGFGLAHFYRGLYLFRMGRVEEAQSAYVRATAFDQNFDYSFYRSEDIGRDNYLFWQGRGFALSRIERFDQAAQAFREAQRIKATNGNVVATPAHIAQFIEANELAERGDWQGALQRCEQSIQGNSRFALAHHCRGLMLDRLRRYPEAVVAFDSALRIEPDSPFSHYRRGNALRKQRNFQAAITAYRQALRGFPNFFEAQNNLGVSHFDLRQKPQALDAFTKALRPEMITLDNDVNSKNTLFNKATVLCFMGRRRESVNTLNQLIPQEDRPALKERAINLRAAAERGRCQ